MVTRAPGLRNLSSQQELTARAQYAKSFFEKMGWTPAQAAGLVANLYHESKFNNSIIGDNGAAYGLAQWHPDRQENFRRAFGYDIRESGFQEQLQFIHYELTRGAERTAGLLLKGAQNPYEAATIVTRYYERPQDIEGEAQKRGLTATRLYATMRGSFQPVSFNPAAMSSAAEKIDAIKEKAMSFAGTPYEYGGETRNGIDCSAFVRELMNAANLPGLGTVIRTGGMEMMRTYARRGLQIATRSSSEMTSENVPDFALIQMDRDHIAMAMTDHNGQRYVLESRRSDGVISTPLDRWMNYARSKKGVTFYVGDISQHVMGPSLQSNHQLASYTRMASRGGFDLGLEQSPLTIENLKKGLEAVGAASLLAQAGNWEFRLKDVETAALERGNPAAGKKAGIVIPSSWGLEQAVAFSKAQLEKLEQISFDATLYNTLTAAQKQAVIEADLPVMEKVFPDTSISFNAAPEGQTTPHIQLKLNANISQGIVSADGKQVDLPENLSLNWLKYSETVNCAKAAFRQLPVPEQNKFDGEDAYARQKLMERAKHDTAFAKFLPKAEQRLAAERKKDASELPNATPPKFNPAAPAPNGRQPATNLFPQQSFAQNSAPSSQAPFTLNKPSDETLAAIAKRRNLLNPRIPTRTADALKDTTGRSALPSDRKPPKRWPPVDPNASQQLKPAQPKVMMTSHQKPPGVSKKIIDQIDGRAPVHAPAHNTPAPTMA